MFPAVLTFSQGQAGSLPLPGLREDRVPPDPLMSRPCAGSGAVHPHKEPGRQGAGGVGGTERQPVSTAPLRLADSGVPRGTYRPRRDVGPALRADKMSPDVHVHVRV